MQFTQTGLQLLKHYLATALDSLLILENQLLHSTKSDMQDIFSFLQILAKYGANIAIRSSNPECYVAHRSLLIIHFKIIIMHNFD